MSSFVVGLLLLVVGLAGVFWGYRIFRILLPILGGFAGYLIALALFPNNLVLALLIGFGLAFLLVLLAYTAWSIMVTISGVVLGGALGAAVAEGLNLWNWVGWIIILVLAVAGGILVWKIRDEVVILLTAITGAAFVATGLRTWFGEVTIRSFVWFIIFIVLALIGIAWQWRRYRHLKLLGMGGPAEMPGTTRSAPVVDTGAPVATTPATEAVVTASAITSTRAEEEPVAVETEALAVEAEAPVAEIMPPVDAGTVDEKEGEPPIDQLTTETVVATELERLEATLDGTELAALQEKVEFVEGIGPSYAGKLNAVGIVTVIDLLRRGATRKGRAELVETSGIAAGLILKWVNHADLFRVKGVGKQFGELLEIAGVDTVPELAQRNPTNLFNKLSEINAEKKLAGRSPHQTEVESWVSQAKNLPRVIEY